MSNIALLLPAKLHLAAVAKTVTHLRCLQLELPFYVPGCSRYVSAYLFFEGLVNLLNQNLKVGTQPASSYPRLGAGRFARTVATADNAGLNSICRGCRSAARCCYLSGSRMREIRQQSFVSTLLETHLVSPVRQR